MPLRILRFTPLGQADDFGLQPLQPLSLGSYLTPRFGDIAPATTPIAPLQPSWQGWSSGIDRYGSMGEMLVGPATTPGYIEPEPMESRYLWRQQFPDFPEYEGGVPLGQSQYPTSAFQQTLKPPPRIVGYEPPPVQPTTPLRPTTPQSFFKPPAAIEPPPRQLGALYPGLTPSGAAPPFFTPLAPYEKYPKGPSLPGPRTAAKIGEALPEEMTVARSAAEALADYDLRRGVRDALGLPTFKAPGERSRPKWDPLGLGGLMEGGPPGFVESTLRATGDVLSAITADPRRLHEPWIPPSQRVQPGIGPTPWQAKTGAEVLLGERGLKGWTQDTAVELARGFVDLVPAMLGTVDIALTNATKGKLTPGPMPSGLFTEAVMEQLKKYGKLPTGGDTWLSKYFSKVTPPAILDRLYAKEAEILKPGVVGKSFEAASRGAFGGTHEDLDKYIKSFQTDASRIAQEEVAKATTFLESVKKLLEYPSTGVLSAIRALPMMYVGQRLGVRAGMGPLMAGVTSEGGFAAGGIAEQARQESPTGYTTASAQAIAAASGGITSMVTFLSGKVASHFGLGDPDTMFAAAQLSERAAMNVVKLFFWTANQEGMEEVIQNSNETVAANLIAGRPLMQGVAASAPMSYFTGVLMAAPSAAMAATPADYAKTKADAAKVAGAVKGAAVTGLNLVSFGKAAGLPVDPMIRERVREIELEAASIIGRTSAFPLTRARARRATDPSR